MHCEIHCELFEEAWHISGTRIAVTDRPDLGPRLFHRDPVGAGYSIQPALPREVHRPLTIIAVTGEGDATLHEQVRSPGETPGEGIVMKEIVAEKVEGGELEILEEIEIEVYAKRGQQQPPAKSYKIRIDKEIKVVHVPSMTGREILGLVGKTPEAYRLYEHIHGKQPQPVDANQPVDFTAPGVERFTTMPRDPTEGRATAPLTRHFQLPEGDEDYLDRMGVDWETVIEDQKRWLIIHEFHIPPGYKISLVKLALLIPPAYPDDQIDMMWFFPAVAREDGRSIGGLSSQIIQSQTYQRWSRHRTGSNPWRPGVDDISSHLTLVDECLRREFSKS